MVHRRRWVWRSLRWRDGLRHLNVAREYNRDHIGRPGKKIGNLTIACGVAAVGLAASVLSGNPP
jgi:hypothetical protein